eukprot:m.161355 g.161355  ORF g.161355 m.161355 type:complete len:503 (+) comp31229_c0_seq1:287-1795(+)
MSVPKRTRPNGTQKSTPDRNGMFWLLVPVFAAAMCSCELSNILHRTPADLSNWNQILWVSGRFTCFLVSQIMCCVVCTTYFIVFTWCVLDLRLVPEAVAQSTAVFFACNLHLTAYASVMVLFTLVNPTYDGAVQQYFLFVTFIPSPVVLSFVITKLLSYKLNIKWGMLQKILCVGVVLFFGYTCQVIQLWLDPQTAWATHMLTVVFYCYSFCTTMGEPEINGSRYWKDLLDFASMQKLLKLVHGFLNITLVWEDLNETLPSLTGKHDQGCGKHGKGCVMGFHPHGMIPYTAALLTTLPNWKNGEAKRVPHFMLASPLHALPFFKDVAQWLGCLEVSKDGISQVLNREGILVLVPGGQTEMLSSKSWGTTLKINDLHLGFVRMALTNGATLIPILSMGEWQLMDNVYVPTLQNWAKAKVGFPIPFIPYGSFVGTPRRKTVTLIVGKPIQSTHGGADVSEEEVAKVHREYFDSLKTLFDKYKSEYGYGDLQMKFMSEDPNCSKF